jgi:hypothetical protein
MLQVRFSHALWQAAERETPVQRLGAVADTGENLAGVMEKREEAIHKTGTDFPKLILGLTSNRARRAICLSPQRSLAKGVDPLVPTTWKMPLQQPILTPCRIS